MTVSRAFLERAAAESGYGPGPLEKGRRHTLHTHLHKRLHRCASTAVIQCRPMAIRPLYAVRRGAASGSPQVTPGAQESRRCHRLTAAVHDRTRKRVNGFEPSTFTLATLRRSVGSRADSASCGAGAPALHKRCTSRHGSSADRTGPRVGTWGRRWATGRPRGRAAPRDVFERAATRRNVGREDSQGC